MGLAATAGLAAGSAGAVGAGVAEGELEPDVPDINIPDQQGADIEGARARQREIDRLRRIGRRQNIASGSVSEALSGNIGKRTLGGAA